MMTKTIIFQTSMSLNTPTISPNDGVLLSLMLSALTSYFAVSEASFSGVIETKTMSCTAATAEPVQKIRFGFIVKRKPAQSAATA